MGEAIALAVKSEVPSTQVSENASLISMIERAARDPEVSIEKVERLYELHAKAEASRAEREFSAAMANAQSELIPVVTNSKNEHTKSSYADLEAIAGQAMPIIHKHGFGLSFSSGKSELPHHVKVICKVRHRGGHSDTSETDWPLDAAGSQGKTNKTAIQAIGSTTTYARRYMTLMAFNIAVKDVDGNTPPMRADAISDDQAMTLREMVESVDGNIDRFLAYFKIANLGDLPSNQYDRAIALLKRKAGQ